MGHRKNSNLRLPMKWTVSKSRLLQTAHSISSTVLAIKEILLSISLLKVMKTIMPAPTASRSSNFRFRRILKPVRNSPIIEGLASILGKEPPKQCIWQSYRHGLSSAKQPLYVQDLISCRHSVLSFSPIVFDKRQGDLTGSLPFSKLSFLTRSSDVRVIFFKYALGERP